MVRDRQGWVWGLRDACGEQPASQPPADEETTSAMQMDHVWASYHPRQTGRPDPLSLLKGKLVFPP